MIFTHSLSYVVEFIAYGVTGHKAWWILAFVLEYSFEDNLRNFGSYLKFTFRPHVSNGAGQFLLDIKKSSGTVRKCENKGSR